MISLTMVRSAFLIGLCLCAALFNAAPCVAAEGSTAVQTLYSISPGQLPDSSRIDEALPIEYESFSLLRSGAVPGLMLMGNFPAVGVTADASKASAQEGSAWSVDRNSRDAQDPVADAGDYLCRFRDKRLTGTIGTVSFPGTDLLNVSLDNPGLMLLTQDSDTRAQAFLLQDNPEDPYDNRPDAGSRIIGGSMRQDVLGRERLILSLTCLEGMRDDPEGTATDADRVNGGAESVLMESRLAGDRLRLRSEYCRSRFSTGTPDRGVVVRDNAWQSRLSGSGDVLSWGVTASRLGPGFMKAAQPGSGEPRSRYSIDSGIDLSPSSIGFTLSRIRDYLDDNGQNPLADTSSGTVRYTYSRTGLPSVTTSYSLRSIEYGNDAGGADKVRNLRQGFSIGSSFESRKWNLASRYTLIRLKDRTGGCNSGSESHSVSIKAGIKPIEDLSIEPLISFSGTFPEEGSARCSSFRSALTTRMKLVPGDLDINTSLSLLESRAADGSIDSTSLRAGGRADWHLDRLTRSGMDKSVSLGAQLAKYRDSVCETTEDEWEVSAVISIGFPANLAGFSREGFTAYQ